VRGPAGGWWWSNQHPEERRFVVGGDSVFCLDVSHDGRYILASYYGSKSLRLWDVETGAEVREFKGHQTPPACVALSPDGRLALSCGGKVEPQEVEKKTEEGKTVKVTELTPVDCVVHVWDVETGQERTPPLASLKTPVHWVAFAPDGKRALACSGGPEYKGAEWVKGKDGKQVPFECVLRVYDVESGRELCKTEGQKDVVWHAAFTPDGKRIISGGMDGTVRVWDAATGKELLSTEVGDKAIAYSLAVSPDGTRLLTGDNQSRLRLWNLDDLEPVQVWKGHAEAVRSVAFSPDGRRALSGGDDYALRLWDLDPVGEAKHFVGHSSFVTSVAFLPDGRRVVSGASDGTIRLWKLP
jgi:WD40 repeat protein